MATLPLVMTLVAAACVVAGVALIVTARRRAGFGPRCGNCRYNLTGATANRCPECGRLFIDAGVIAHGNAWSRPRLWIGIIILATIVPLTGSGILTTLMYRRVAAAQAEAARERATAQAINTFLNNTLSSVGDNDQRTPTVMTFLQRVLTTKPVASRPAGARDSDSSNRPNAP